MPDVVIALAQISSRAGDVDANAQKILAAAHQAVSQGVNLLLTPEYALSGYPSDIVLHPDFVQRQQQAFNHLADNLAQLPGLQVLVGHIHADGKQLYSAASLLDQGGVQVRYCKNRLRSDEHRYFQAGSTPGLFDSHGRTFAIALGDDVNDMRLMQNPDFIRADCLLSLDSSPFFMGQEAYRLEYLSQAAGGRPLVYVNATGVHDEQVFDGASLAFAANNEIVARLPLFEEAVHTVCLSSSLQGRQPMARWPEPVAQVYEALTFALREYVAQAGFPSVLLGLSGGLDSALVLAIAVDALGSERVRTVMMPSGYTADISLQDAYEMAAGLGVHHDVIAIDGLMAQYDQVLAPLFAGYQPDTTEENLQARIRGNLLMALSNKFGGLVVNTSNKSEAAVGYSTLYGDMVGGFALLKDVPKTLVYSLANWRNRQSAVIPQRIIDRPPSAELRADQTDQDSLPSYDILDAIIERYVDQNQTAAEIVAAGYEAAVVSRVVRLIHVSEYKRRQGAIGPKISPRTFGLDWRFPIVHSIIDVV